MGRFDALTQLEEPNKPSTPTSVATPINIQQPKAVKKQSSELKKPTKPQTVKSTNPPLDPDPLERPEKYTTHLEPSLVKKLKLHATEKDMKDYQVIKNALLLYFEFEKNK